MIGDLDFNNMPEGETFDAMINNINSTISLYARQFVGQVIEETYNYTFKLIPEPKNKIIQQILFRFSPEYGILKSGDLRGEPIIIEIENLETTKSFKNFTKTQEILRRVEKRKRSNNGFAYRLPEQAIVRIKTKHNILAQQKLFIAQYGQILYLSKELILSDFSIEFNPELGSLKSITQNNK